MTSPYPFNDDLLLGAEAQAAAKQYYPSVYEALHHPELLAEFGPRNEAANAAKRQSWWLGFVAVALVTAALLLASSEPLIGGPHAEEAHGIGRWIAFASGVAGAVGTAIGCVGILFGGAKRRWLEARLATERLRQFHFQSLLALAPEIVAAAGSGDWAAFKQRRAAEFRRFQEDVLARVPTVFDTLVADDAEPEPALFGELGPGEGAGNEALFTAYRRLRIERQIQYASYKLQRTSHLSVDLPLSQMRVLDNGALVCVLGLVLLHGLIIVGVFDGSDLQTIHVFAIWLAIAALALRTLEEGLRPHREVERYRDYRAALRNIDRKFVGAATPTAKFAAMADLEVLTYDEMVNFLKSYHEARFVM